MARGVRLTTEEASVKVKGNVIKARESFTQESFGASAWDRVLASLTEQDRQLFSGILTNAAWYPFDAAIRLDEAIVRILGGGNTTLYEALGAASAKLNLSGVHRNFLEPPIPLAFMKKADMIYRFYYDSGHRTWESSSPSSGFLTTHEAQQYAASDCLTVIGWYKQGLLLCGASAVSIDEQECRAHGGVVCRFLVSWRE